MSTYPIPCLESLPTPTRMPKPMRKKPPFHFFHAMHSHLIFLGYPDAYEMHYAISKPQFMQHMPIHHHACIDNFTYFMLFNSSNNIQISSLEIITIYSQWLTHNYYDAPKSGCSLTTRQPTEYPWMSGNPTPLMKFGQSLLCTGSSTQGKNLSQQVYNDHTGSTYE